jgi:hypothetical protein
VGSSFTGFRGRGFWARDLKVEVWLYVLGLIVDRQLVRPAWLVRVGEHWREQATVGFNGVVDAGLDGQVGIDPARLVLLIGLAEQAEQYLRQRQVLTAGELAAAGVAGWQARRDGDLDTALVLPVARAFIDLLAGRVSWDASTSPVL